MQLGFPYRNRLWVSDFRLKRECPPGDRAVVRPNDQFCFKRLNSGKMPVRQLKNMPFGLPKGIPLLDEPTETFIVREVGLWPVGVSGKEESMLVLSRKKDESIVINNDITIVVVEIRGDKVRLGVEAPKEVPVHRREVFDAIARGEPVDAKVASGVRTAVVIDHEKSTTETVSPLVKPAVAPKVD